MVGLRVEREDDVLRVTLAKPERRNAFDAELIAELHEAFSDVGDARVVVLAGAGESFCAGEAVERFAGEILKSGPEAARAAKRLAREAPHEGEELALIAAGLRAGAEGQEGLRAFLEKRTPAWRSESSS